jgi:hypothetical protein
MGQGLGLGPVVDPAELVERLPLMTGHPRPAVVLDPVAGRAQRHQPHEPLYPPGVVVVPDLMGMELAARLAALAAVAGRLVGGSPQPIPHRRADAAPNVRAPGG